MKIKLNKKAGTNYKSMIVALTIISESELAEAMDYSPELENDTLRFNMLMHSLGMDINYKIEKQENIQHRNNLGKIVQCNRWVGHSRIDDEWLSSGYASREAKDKAKGSRLLDDLYRSRNETEDAQAVLESREQYRVEEDELEGVN